MLGVYPQQEEAEARYRLRDRGREGHVGLHPFVLVSLPSSLLSGESRGVCEGEGGGGAEGGREGGRGWCCGGDHRLHHQRVSRNRGGGPGVGGGQGEGEVRKGEEGGREGVAVAYIVRECPENRREALEKEAGRQRAR